MCEVCNTERESVWACPICTFFNPNSTSTCSACQAVCGPPAAAPPPTDDDSASVDRASSSQALLLEPELVSLLDSLSLSHLAPSLAQHEVVGIDVFRLLTDDNLQAMGIAMGSRIRLLDALKSLMPAADSQQPPLQPAPPPATRPPPEPVSALPPSIQPTVQPLPGPAQPSALPPVPSLPPPPPQQCIHSQAAPELSTSPLMPPRSALSEAMSDFVLVDSNMVARETDGTDLGFGIAHASHGLRAGSNSSSTHGQPSAEVACLVEKEEPFVSIDGGDGDAEDERAPLVERTDPSPSTSRFTLFGSRGAAYKPLE